MRIIEVTTDRAAVSRRVLGALPEWFGIPEALEGYVAHAAGAPMLGAEAEGGIVGYASLQDCFGRNCEIHSMGVMPVWHRRGAGRALVEAAARWAAERGYRALSVKTLGEAHPDPHYAATRAFYLAAGFEPFAALDGLWGPDLPCLMLVRPL